jgi:hypothetical protein
MAGGRSALLISVGRFQNPGLARLRSPAIDANALMGLLADENIGGYDTQAFVDQNSTTVRRAIDEFFSDAHRDELKVLYFAGHGIKDANGRLHLAATDTELRFLASTGISAEFINQAMNDSRAGQIVLILDCCYSGAFPRGVTARSTPTIDVGDQLSGRRRVIITATNALEFAFEGDEGPTGDDTVPRSVFTKALIDGLRTGDADLDGDGIVTVDELYEYVFDEVRRVSEHQTPGKWTFDVGDPVVFARVPAPGRISKPPPEPPAEPEPETDVDWATDAPARQDHLNRASLADVLAGRLREVRRDDPSTSFLMHVDGPWGTGKSSLLNFLDDRLKSEFTIVRFDAWRQSRISPPWWALLTATRRGITAPRNAFSSGWLRLRETMARARRSGAPYVLAVILLIILVTVFATVVWPTVAAGQPIANVAKAATAVLAVVATLWAGALVASRFLLWDSARGARMFEQSTAGPMDEVAAHFAWLLGKSKKPVLLFIDDLDRCPAPYVVELLDSVQTLIRDATTKSAAAYFVVAADGAWLRKSYESAYGSFGDTVSTPGYPLGYLFLDKLFQLTVPVPVPTRRAQSTYLDRLLRVGNTRSSAGTKEEVQAAKVVLAREAGDETSILRVLNNASAAAREDLVADAARALAEPETRARTEHALRRFLPLLHSNPRNVKKFLNTYSVLRAVRVLENNTVASDTLALWTIVRVRWPSMADWLETSPDAIRGILEPLWAAECFPEDLRELAADRELREVVRFREGGPLTPRLIRQCCGTEDH